MPNQPFPVSGHVYEWDNTTPITSGVVWAFNVSNDESTSLAINSSGEYTVDLGSTSTQWVAGDEIHIKAYSNDNRFGYYRFIITTGQTSKEEDINIDVSCDLERHLEDRGENVTVEAVTVTVDSNGHDTSNVIHHILFADPQIYNGQEQEENFGVLQLGDISLYVSANDSNKKYASTENHVVYDNSIFRIVNVIKERGIHGGAKWSHYELLCKRISDT